MTFEEILAADRRLATLRLLEEAGGELGESTIEKSLGLIGFRTKLTREVVQADLKILEKLHLVEVSYYQDRYMVAKLCRRGVQVAQGVIVVEGVSKPQIGV